MKPRLLDLFCGAGGAAMGYHRAGFEVVGVDIKPQPSFPFEFHQADALEFIHRWREFDVIHASPPCQAYTRLRFLPWIRDREYWDSVPPTLAALAEVDIPWIVENVEGAPLDGITLCGQMFGLEWPDGVPIYRHRLFAMSPDLFMLAPGHPKHYRTISAGPMVGDRIAKGFGLSSGRYIGGHNSAVNNVAGGPLGVDWMKPKEVTQAIPPAYTEWIGRQLLTALERAA